MGDRGTVYAGKALQYPQEMEITAMADIRRSRLDAANKYLHLPEDRLFDSAQALLNQPKLSVWTGGSARSLPATKRILSC